MKRILHFLIIILTMNTAIAQQAPLLDRELFFGNPEISGGQISPDGEWISFLKEYDGIMNIWVKKFDAPFETAKPLTDSKRPLYGYFWTNDSKYILYVKDKNGDENINIFAVNPLASPEQEGSVPTSRNLTPLKDVTAQIQKVSKKDPDVLFISLNDRDKAWHDLSLPKYMKIKIELLATTSTGMNNYAYLVKPTKKVIPSCTALKKEMF
jgi:hypothetical protein